jgi:hypothetical protein
MRTLPGEPSQAALILSQSSIPALRRLVVEETASSIVISGQLPSYYLKQLAQEALMPGLAGRRLFNRVEVIRNHELDF